MDGETAAGGPRSFRGAGQVFAVLAAVLLCGSWALRMRGVGELYRVPGAVALDDLDTQRRLVRIASVAAAESYPVREVADGFPDGTVSHWTRPFDWFVVGLNAVVSPFVSRGTGYERGAVYAGPVLGVLCIAAFLWGAVRLLGHWPGLLAAGFYALQYPVVKMSEVGNGDHQGLQHLCLLGFVLPWLLRRAGRRSAWIAAASGAALGLAVWVSTESFALCLLWVGVTGGVRLLAGSDRDPGEAWRCVGVLLMLLAGHAVEQGEPWALHWDQVSWFQIYPVLVFTGFVVAARSLRPWVAAGLALCGGVAGLLLIPGFLAALGREFAALAAANVWLQSAVSEFRPSFFDGVGFSVGAGVDRFTPVVLVLPLLVAAVARWGGLGPDRGACARVVLLCGAACTFGFALYETKLSHLFAPWFALVVVAGGRALSDRLAAARRPVVAGCAAAVLLGCAVPGLPPGRLPELARHNDDQVREICGFLRQQQGAGRASVMAPWDLGAPIMYQAGWPVVASGYHRNLEGIRDGYRFFLAQPGEDTVVREILTRRKVRFVVAWYDRGFARDGQAVLGRPGEFHTPAGYTEAFATSLFWRLRSARPVPGFRLRLASRFEIRRSRDGPPEPIFKIFEVE